ncbi:MAG: GyaR protein [Firmicutes bacterium]|nr:GyaR protein [Bacillota bacterium]
MRVALLVNKDNVERYTPPGTIPADWELFHLGNDSPPDVDKLIATNAEAVLVDPILPFTAAMIKGLPQLKLIHSQGVAYNLIDLEAARKAGVYVCNCAGVNAPAVAEQAILLMLALLRRFGEYEKMVYAARQIEAKNACFKNGLTELASCHVGIIGLGATGRELAKRLQAFGCKVSYYSRREVPGCGLPRIPLDEIYRQCDIISLHVPVTAETTGMINDAAFNKMKRGAILINTARGELVDQEALCRALMDGRLGGAGLDTLSPEPVRPDNPVINLPEEVRHKVALSPHIAGITAESFRRSSAVIWDNMKRVSTGQRPLNIVNGL